MSDLHTAPLPFPHLFRRLTVTLPPQRASKARCLHNHGECSDSRSKYSTNRYCSIIILLYKIRMLGFHVILKIFEYTLNHTRDKNMIKFPYNHCSSGVSWWDGVSLRKMIVGTQFQYFLNLISFGISISYSMRDQYSQKCRSRSSPRNVVNDDNSRPKRIS